MYNYGPRPTQLKLTDYYDGDEEPDEPHIENEAGLWVLLKKTSGMANYLSIARDYMYIYAYYICVYLYSWLFHSDCTREFVHFSGLRAAVLPYPLLLSRTFPVPGLISGIFPGIFP